MAGLALRSCRARAFANRHYAASGHHAVMTCGVNHILRVRSCQMQQARELFFLRIAWTNSWWKTPRRFRMAGQSFGDSMDRALNLRPRTFHLVHFLLSSNYKYLKHPRDLGCSNLNTFHHRFHSKCISLRFRVAFKRDRKWRNTN